MLESDDSVMSLDLSCRSDGLLVGFSNRSPLRQHRSPVGGEQEHGTALLSSSQRKSSWGRLFRRQSTSAMEEKSLLHQPLATTDDQYHYQDDGDDEYDGRYGLVSKQLAAPYHDTTFHQEEKDFRITSDRSNNMMLQKNFRDSTNTKSSSYRDNASSGRYPPGSKQQQLVQWKSQSCSELPTRGGGGCGGRGMQGFGNSDPRRDDFASSSKSEGFGSFFKRLYDRQDDRQAMRIATEDTMEETSWTENLGRVAAVLLAPELCDDPDEDLDRLAQYRSIGSDVDDEEDNYDDKNQWTESKRNEAALWKTEVQRLKGYIEKLEKDLKIRDMEAMSWKQRAKELEQELRKATGRGDDESTACNDSERNGDDTSNEDDDEEDEHKIVEGDLLGLATESNIVEPSGDASIKDHDTAKQQTESSASDTKTVHPTMVTENQQQPVNDRLLLLVDDQDAGLIKDQFCDPLSAQNTNKMVEGHGNLGLIHEESKPELMLKV